MMDNDTKKKLCNSLRTCNIEDVVSNLRFMASDKHEEQYYISKTELNKVKQFLEHANLPDLTKYANDDFCFSYEWDIEMLPFRRLVIKICKICYDECKTCEDNDDIIDFYEWVDNPLSNIICAIPLKSRGEDTFGKILQRDINYDYTAADYFYGNTYDDLYF